MVEGKTSWTMPPDVLEQVNVTRLSKYPRCLPDHGLWASLRIWCFFFSHHARPSRTAAGGEFLPHLKNSKSTITATPQPYWCEPGATKAHNGRTSSIIDLNILASNILPQVTDNQDLNRVFLPALKLALSNNKFFTGIKMSTPTRRAESSTPVDNKDIGVRLAHPMVALLKLIQSAAPTMVELNLPSVPPNPTVGVLPSLPMATSRELGVEIWSGQSMPKKDFLGKIDTFVEVSLVAGATSGLTVQKGTGVAKSDVIKSNYHPDYHDPEHLGRVDTIKIPLVPDGKTCVVCNAGLVAAGAGAHMVGEHVCPELRLVGVVQDWNTVKSSDLVGNIEVPAPPPGAETEGWVTVKDAKGAVIKGHDKNESKVYVRQSWMDTASASLGVKVPDVPAGKLVSIDLSWRDNLAPNVVKYVMHHAGVVDILTSELHRDFT